MPYNRDDLKVGMFLVYDHETVEGRRHKIMSVGHETSYGFRCEYRTYVGMEFQDSGTAIFKYHSYTIYDPSKRKPRYKPREYCYERNAGGPITPIHRDAETNSPRVGSSDPQAWTVDLSDINRFNPRLEPTIGDILGQAIRGRRADVIILDDYGF